ncbi:MAG TPA: hypothetical protein VJ723_00135 [Candidatus Angelobacter sp.]|nr:hypothetical protein [Candidatus Angelobacter sp.]
MWLGARYTGRDRDTAVERGLQFIDGVASNTEHFAEWGHDLLWCFCTISRTAKNKKLREMARRMGEEHARRWRREHTQAPVDDPDELANFVFGTDIADQLLDGSDPVLKRHIQEAVRRFSAVDFLEFDPRREAPPSDIPESCPKCEHDSPRGVTVCQKCKGPLRPRSPYDVWLDALVTTFSGEAYGVDFGASYPEVLQWISQMRPYPAPANEAEFDDVSYAITHVVYTLNGYGKYRLSPAWLPQEFNYLRTNIREAERYQDWETVGEFMDTLRAFGQDESDHELRSGMDHLLANQNPDGSWGDMNDPDIYVRYHSTWTVIDGLRQYAFQGERLRYPELLPRLRGDHDLPAHQKAGAERAET